MYSTVQPRATIPLLRIAARPKPATWLCHHCFTRNPQRRKSCGCCGRPKPARRLSVLLVGAA